MLLPSLPTAITVLLAVGYMLWSFAHHQEKQDLSIWAITNAVYDVVLFAILIYFLPIAKNRKIILFTLSYIIHIMGDIMGTNIYYVTPYFSHLTPEQFMWTFSDLLLIYSLVGLFKKENQKPRRWFYRVDSARVQMGYWCNSIASILFLLVGIRYTLFSFDYKISQLIFHANIIVFIPFVTLLTLSTLFFAQLFNKDFSDIGAVMSRFSLKKKVKQKKQRTIYFKELHNLTQFIQEKMDTIAKKTEQEKQLYNMTKTIAKNIQQPLSIISNISQKLEENFDLDQQEIHKTSLTRIKMIADELLNLGESSAMATAKKEESQPLGNYVSINFHELMQEKNVQHSKLAINIKTKIDSSAWFVLSPIYSNDFYRIIANLINNAIDATEQQKEREISCHLKYTSNATFFQVAIKDNGCGIKQQQIANILAGKSKTTKETGHGIGLRYVIETIEKWHGKCEISSTVGKGTEFLITLPVLLPIPPWWLDQIILPAKGTIIVYDSEQFYHNLWEGILSPYTYQQKELNLVHCYTLSDLEHSIKPDGNQLILFDIDDFANNHQELDLIGKHHLQNSAIYVTEEYKHKAIQSKCQQEKIKLFPKALIPHIRIKTGK